MIFLYNIQSHTIYVYAHLNLRGVLAGASQIVAETKVSI